MKRIIGILVFAIAIVVLVCLTAYAKLDLILSHVLTSKFGTRVQVEAVNFQPMNYIDVEKIKVANPHAYTSPYALEIGFISISAPYKHYVEKIIEIEKIEVRNTLLTVEYFNKVTNWETLMAQLDTEDEPSMIEDSHSYSIIKELTFTDLNVRVAGVNGSYTTYPIKKLTLHNIKTKEGELTRRLTQAILNEIIFNIKNFIQIPLKASRDLLNSPVDTTLDGIKALNPFGK